MFGADVRPKGMRVNWYCLSSAEKESFSWSHCRIGME